MPLNPGAKLGSYEILSPIGKGGMGEVYRARDLNLRRDVAIKVLPESFASDPERLGRFRREAEVLASLNHPNIATVFGAESNALVMELVEGPMLSERIQQGALPLDEALTVARQIIDAVEYAHEHRVIHRDLKPANVKITPDGLVKVLDFGLAKALNDVRAVSENPGDSPTLTLGHTQAGVILGTAAYMSPEQAVGKELDRRSDIFSFGAVFFEMLTGRRAFQGESTGDILAAVVKTEPDWSALPEGTPSVIRKLVQRCLHKDRKLRLQAIGEARIAIEEFRLVGEPVVVPVAVSAAPTATPKWPWAVAGVLAVALAGVSWLHFRGAGPEESRLVQSEIAAPDGVTAILYAGLSPDGSKVVFSTNLGGGRYQSYIRQMNSLTATLIPGSENAKPSIPFWSPDGQWVAFPASGKLMKWNPASGLPPQLICNADVNLGGTWNEDGVILFDVANKPLQRVPAGGGVPVNAFELDTKFGEDEHIAPRFLPGGKALLFQSNGKVRGAQFFATLDGSVRRHLYVNGNGPAVFVPEAGGGFIAYVRGFQLLRRPMNPQSGELGEPVLLIDGIVNGPAFTFAGADLIYSPQPDNRRQIRWYSRDGVAGDAVGGPSISSTLDFSPDEKRAVVAVRESNKGVLVVFDFARGTTERIADGNNPAWAPDGKILYGRQGKGEGLVLEKAPDALSPETVIARVPVASTPASLRVSADGKVVVAALTGGGGSQTWVINRPEGNTREANLAAVSASVPAISPDGRWLAQAAASGVFVRQVPVDPNQALPSETRELSSKPAGGSVRWSHDGKEIFYRDSGAFYSIPIDWADGTPRGGVPRKLFDAPRASQFTVSRDGKRFLVSETLNETSAQPMVLVQNWRKLLEQ